VITDADLYLWAFIFAAAAVGEWYRFFLPVGSPGRYPGLGQLLEADEARGYAARQPILKNRVAHFSLVRAFA